MQEWGVTGFSVMEKCCSVKLPSTHPSSPSCAQLQPAASQWVLPGSGANYSLVVMGDRRPMGDRALLGEGDLGRKFGVGGVNYFHPAVLLKL